MSCQETDDGGGYVDWPCPYCCEDRVDFLVWQDDETVQCTSCGRSYKPIDQGD